MAATLHRAQRLGCASILPELSFGRFLSQRLIAGLWGVGVGGVFLPKLRSLSLRVSACGLKAPRAVFAANPPDKVVDAFAGMSGRAIATNWHIPIFAQGVQKFEVPSSASKQCGYCQQ